MTGFPSSGGDFSTLEVVIWVLLFTALLLIASLPLFAACAAIVRQYHSRTDDDS